MLALISLGLLAVFISLLAGVLSGMIGKKVAVSLGSKISAISTVGFGTVPMAVGILIFGAGVLPINYVIISLASGFFLALGFVLRYMALRTE